MTSGLEKAREEHAKRLARVQALSAQMTQKREDLQRVRAEEKAALVSGDDGAAERGAAEAAALERRLAVLPAALEEAEAAAAVADRALADALLPGALESATEAGRIFEEAVAATHLRAADVEKAAQEVRWVLSRSSYGPGGGRHGEEKPRPARLSALAAGYLGRARELREGGL